jgi:hypothetical protein
MCFLLSILLLFNALPRAQSYGFTCVPLFGLAFLVSVYGQNDCTAGFYKDGTNSTCLACPDGTTSPDTSFFLTDCYCEPGTWGPAGGPCEPCTTCTSLQYEDSTCTNRTDRVCVDAVCGDYIKQPNEQCDNGPFSGQGCDSSCQFEDASGTASGDDFLCVVQDFALTTCCPTLVNPFTQDKVCTCRGLPSPTEGLLLNQDCTIYNEDECMANNGGCHEAAICINEHPTTDNSTHRCVCPPGMKGDGVTRCDIYVYTVSTKVIVEGADIYSVDREQMKADIVSSNVYSADVTVDDITINVAEYGGTFSSRRRLLQNTGIELTITIESDSATDNEEEAAGANTANLVSALETTFAGSAVEMTQAPTEEILTVDQAFGPVASSLFGFSVDSIRYDDAAWEWILRARYVADAPNVLTSLYLTKPGDAPYSTDVTNSFFVSNHPCMQSDSVCCLVDYMNDYTVGSFASDVTTALTPQGGRRSLGSRRACDAGCLQEPEITQCGTSIDQGRTLCFIDELDGNNLYCWGENDMGQAGTGSASPAIVLSPTLVNLPTGRHALKVAISYKTTCVQLDDLTIKCFGDNSKKLASPTDATTPILSTNDDGARVFGNTQYVAGGFSCWYYRCCAVRNADRTQMDCWGQQISNTDYEPKTHTFPYEVVFFRVYDDGVAVLQPNNTVISWGWLQSRNGGHWGPLSDGYSTMQIPLTEGKIESFETLIERAICIRLVDEQGALVKYTCQSASADYLQNGFDFHASAADGPIFPDTLAALPEGKTSPIKFLPPIEPHTWWSYSLIVYEDDTIEVFENEYSGEGYTLNPLPGYTADPNNPVIDVIAYVNDFQMSLIVLVQRADHTWSTHIFDMWNDSIDNYPDGRENEWYQDILYDGTVPYFEGKFLNTMVCPQDCDCNDAVNAPLAGLAAAAAPGEICDASIQSQQTIDLFDTSINDAAIQNLLSEYPNSYVNVINPSTLDIHLHMFDLRHNLSMVTDITSGYEMEFYLGMSYYTLLPAPVLSTIASQVNIKATYTDTISFAMSSEQDYTFIKYITVALFDTKTIMYNLVETHPQFVKVSFVLPEGLTQNLKTGLVPLTSVRYAIETSLPAPEDATKWKNPCYSSTQTGLWDSNYNGSANALYEMYQASKLQSCAAQEDVCVNPVTAGALGSLNSFSFPIGDGTVDSSILQATESYSLYVSFQVSVVQATGRAVQTRLFVQAPLKLNSMTRMCETLEIAKELKDVVDISVALGVVGIESLWDSSIRTTANVDDLTGVTPLSVDVIEPSIASSLLTIIVQGSDVSFSGQLATAYHLEIEDVVSLHFLDNAAYENVVAIINAGGAWDIKKNTASNFLEVDLSSAILNECFSQTVPGDMTCTLRRDIQRRSVLQSYAMHSFATGVGTHDMQQTSAWMQENIFGFSEYADDLARNYTSMIRSRYAINDRYKKAWYFNPGYKWTAQAGSSAQSILSLSDKTIFFAIVTLDDGSNFEARNRRRMLLQVNTESGRITDSFQQIVEQPVGVLFPAISNENVDPLVQIAHAHGVEEKFGFFKFSITGEVQADGVVSSVHIRNKVEESIRASLSKISPEATNAWIVKFRSNVDAVATDTIRRLLGDGVQHQYSADLEILIAFNNFNATVFENELELAANYDDSVKLVNETFSVLISEANTTEQTEAFTRLNIYYDNLVALDAGQPTPLPDPYASLNGPSENGSPRTSGSFGLLLCLALFSAALFLNV